MMGEALAATKHDVAAVGIPLGPTTTPEGSLVWLVFVGGELRQLSSDEHHAWEAAAIDGVADPALTQALVAERLLLRTPTGRVDPLLDLRLVPLARTTGTDPDRGVVVDVGDGYSIALNALEFGIWTLSHRGLTLSQVCDAVAQEVPRPLAAIRESATDLARRMVSATAAALDWPA